MPLEDTAADAYARLILHGDQWWQWSRTQSPGSGVEPFAGTPEAFALHVLDRWTQASAGDDTLDTENLWIQAKVWSAARVVDSGLATRRPTDAPSPHEGSYAAYLHGNKIAPDAVEIRTPLQLDRLLWEAATTKAHQPSVT